MVQKFSLLSVVLLLLLVLAPSFDAVPTSRSLRMFNDEESVHEFYYQDVDDIGGDNEVSNIEGLLERRMDIQTMDYPGPGANNRHDPKTPGIV